jgi:hypothetical protein
MIKIQNIGDEAIQRHTIIFQEFEITLTLRFYPKVQMWCFDCEFLDWEVHGLRLAVGVLHMVSENQPFDFYVIDESGNGLDPFQINDFSTGRCSLYMLEEADMVEIRKGAEVPFG